MNLLNWQKNRTNWSKLLNIFIIGGLIAIIMVSTIPFQIVGNQKVMAASNNADKILGFTGYTWDSSINLDEVDYLMWTHIDCAGNSNPTLVTAFGTPWSTLVAAANACHAKGVKFIPSLFSSSNTSAGYTNITTILQSSTLRAQLVTNIKNLLVNYGWDGINLDIEITSNKAAQRPYMDALISELYTALHPLGKVIGVSSAWYAYDFSLNVAYMVDLNNVMCYDLWSTTLPDGQRIYGTSTESYNDTVKIMDYWIEGRYPKNKLYMGIPSYSSPQDGYITQKAQWVIDNGLAGMMIFEVNSTEPLNTVFNDFISANPAPTPVLTSP